MRDLNLGVIGAAIATSFCYFINFALANLISRFHPSLNKAYVKLDFS